MKEQKEKTRDKKYECGRGIIPGVKALSDVFQSVNFSSRVLWSPYVTAG